MFTRASIKPKVLPYYEHNGDSEDNASNTNRYEKLSNCSANVKRTILLLKGLFYYQRQRLLSALVSAVQQKAQPTKAIFDETSMV